MNLRENLMRRLPFLLVLGLLFALPGRAASAQSGIPTRSASVVGIHVTPTARPLVRAEMLQARKAKSTTLMIVGGAAFIGGLLIGDTVGTAIAIGGLGVGIYGLFLYLE